MRAPPSVREKIPDSERAVAYQAGCFLTARVSASGPTEHQWFALRDCRSWPGRLRPRPERRPYRPHGVGDGHECLVAGQLAGSGRDGGVDRAGDGVERRGQLVYRAG
jgi:hypothetical protein